MIVGIGQVTLDLVVNVDDDPGVFTRYGIEKNTQCLAEEKHHPLIADLLTRAEDGADSSVSPTPGGVVPNSLRGAAWLQRQQGSAAGGDSVPPIKMIGMVGRDKAAARMREELRSAGVEPLLDEIPADSGAAEGSPATKTGVCCCLIAGHNRTMVTDLRAGRTLELHGKKAPVFPGWEERIAAAQAGTSSAPVIVVLSAFYIQADPEGSAAICDWCAAAPGRLLAMTVSAEWCCHQPAVQRVAQSADFMFGNEPETVEIATALAAQGVGPKPGTFEEAVSLVARWKTRGWVVATRGAKSVEALHSKSVGPPLEVPVEKVPPEEFADDVGAGDAFMGGFVAVLWQRAAALKADFGHSDPYAKLAARSWQAAWCSCCSSRDRDEGDDETDELGLADRVSADDIRACMAGGIRAASAAVRSVGCQFAEAK